MRIGAGSRFLRAQRMGAFQAVASGAHATWEAVAELVAGADLASPGPTPRCPTSPGSAQSPRFLDIRYQGAAADAPSICLVGKGITFDRCGGCAHSRAARLRRLAAATAADVSRAPFTHNAYGRAPNTAAGSPSSLPRRWAL